MKLKDYPKNEIEAAMKMKGLNYPRLAEKLGRAVQTVNKAVNGKSGIESHRLNSQIVTALQPELEIIHNAFSPAQLQGAMVNEELKMQLVNA